ncbi:MAG: N-formylglutamate amidohydrolase [Lewinella sp.]|nr:N-formylglutamate amidohydrolase [Lewinella sp.]
MYPETILPIVAHIPHAGIEIPAAVRGQFVPGSAELWREILLLSDWYTDELFAVPGIATVKTPISRLVVDLERFTDNSREPRAAVGQGVVYTHRTDGSPLRRQLSDSERRNLLENYYRPWHLQLELDIIQQTTRWGHCLLLDCHSFPDEPFANEQPDRRGRPDICLGLSDSNSPAWLVDSFTEAFTRAGYSVELDTPYAGCLVPEQFRGNPSVPAIMVEVNRRLYLEWNASNPIGECRLPDKTQGFDQLRYDICSIMLQVTQELHCRLPQRSL